MITDNTPVLTVKIPPHAVIPPDKYPHYRLNPINGEAGRHYCLLFCLSETAYLVLEPKLKRYEALRRLSEHLQAAPFTVYETTVR